MFRRETEGIQYLEFELFQKFPNLKAAVFLRHGGKSVGKYASLNLSLSVGDDKEHVLANENKVLNLMGLQKLIRANLCHGKDIIEAKDYHLELTFDAITTNELNHGLMITHADCQAACFYDPVHHAVANVHAGFRGSCQNIYAETIRFMQKTYGTNPSDLHVGISPSLGPLDAEFVNYQNELPKSFWEYQIKPNYFDFWQITLSQLLECGLKQDHIEIASISTFSNPQDYFSYRLDNVTGRNATVVALT